MTATTEVFLCFSDRSDEPSGLVAIALPFNATVADLQHEIAVHPKFSLAEEKQLLWITDDLKVVEGLNATQRGKTLAAAGIVNGTQVYIDKWVEATNSMYTMSQDQSDSGAWQPRVQLPCGDCYTPCNLVKRARAQYKNGYCKLECQTETSQIHQFSYVTILVEGTKVKKTCKEPLSSEVLSKYGMLTPPEIMEFSIALNEALMRGLGDVQCTQCGMWGSRKDRKNPRVVCASCNGYEYCYWCCRKWIGSGTAHCGNKGCPELDPRLQILQTGTDITTKGHGDVPIKDLRACGNRKCGYVVAYGGHCKHFTCPLCGTEYCMSCLAIKTNGSWPATCGNFNTKCPVAPIQTSITDE